MIYGILGAMKSPKTPKKTKAGEGTSGTTDQGGCATTIDAGHYTPQGEHPEDRIYRDREYIHRLRLHMDEVYDALEKDLGIKEGQNWLFDFVHNEDRTDEFEDYLREYAVRYADIARRARARGRRRVEAAGAERRQDEVRRRGEAAGLLARGRTCLSHSTRDAGEGQLVRMPITHPTTATAYGRRAKARPAADCPASSSTKAPAPPFCLDSAGTVVPTRHPNGARTGAAQKPPPFIRDHLAIMAFPLTRRRRLFVARHMTGRVQWSGGKSGCSGNNGYRPDILLLHGQRDSSGGR